MHCGGWGRHQCSQKHRCPSLCSPENPSEPAGYFLAQDLVGKALGPRLGHLRTALAPGGGVTVVPQALCTLSLTSPTSTVPLLVIPQGLSAPCCFWFLPAERNPRPGLLRPLARSPSSLWFCLPSLSGFLPPDPGRPNLLDLHFLLSCIPGHCCPVDGHRWLRLPLLLLSFRPEWKQFRLLWQGQQPAEETPCWTTQLLPPSLLRVSTVSCLSDFPHF